MATAAGAYGVVTYPITEMTTAARIWRCPEFWRCGGAVTAAEPAACCVDRDRYGENGMGELEMQRMAFKQSKRR